MSDLDERRIGENELAPEHLNESLHAVNEAFAHVRTTLIRAENLPVPEDDPQVTPEQLAEHLDRDDVPGPLRPVRDAVHAGETTWSGVLHMGLAAAVERFRPSEEDQAAQGDEPAEEPEDFSELPVMRDGW
ncbi:hypothetical protein ABZ639_28920 [Saccharomonospora sp. NPDC006951]